MCRITAMTIGTRDCNGFSDSCSDINNFIYKSDFLVPKSKNLSFIDMEAGYLLYFN